MQSVRTPINSAAIYDEGLRAHMTSTYSLIASGLFVTTAAAAATLNTPLLSMMINEAGMTGLGYVLLFAPLGILLATMFGMLGKSVQSAKFVYWAFVALQGPALALVTMRYTGASVVNAAAVTAATFLGASLYGYTTKRSLTSMGSFLVMGLIGIILASLINLFFASSMISWVVSCAAVIIFTGLTAWETQSLKRSYDISLMGEEGLTKLKYTFALNLYLNIINLFQSFLNLTGSKD